MLIIDCELSVEGPPSLPATLSAREADNMATTNDQINAAQSVMEDLIPQLDGLGDVDSVEGVAIRFDVLKRPLVSIGIEEIIEQLVDTIEFSTGTRL